jgi:hypothetical protein
VQTDAYLLERARYVVLNPVRAGMARTARDWPWSSYRATAGDIEPPEWLSTDWLLSAFGSRRGAARLAYRQFVSEGRGQGSPWRDLKQQIYLGDVRFVERMQGRLEDTTSLDEVPRTQRRAPAKTLDHYARTHDRDAAITAAYLDGAYTMKAIGDHFGLHYSMVSRIVAARNSRLKT